MIIALWCRYLELAGAPGNNYEIQDALGESLTSAAKDSIQRNSLSLLKIESVFGDLARSERFVATYLPLITRLRESGVEGAIRQLLQA
jgi:mannitol-1-phosphate/altronate dehydrogenase